MNPYKTSVTTNNDDDNIPVITYPLADGRTLDMKMSWFAKSRDTGDRIVGLTRFVYTNNGGSLDQVGGSDRIEMHAITKDTGFDDVILEVDLSIDTDVTIRASQDNTLGIIDWDFIIDVDVY